MTNSTRKESTAPTIQFNTYATKDVHVSFWRGALKNA